jgi:xylulokinase
MDYVIGVDIGTQSTKALLCDAKGRIVAQRSRAYKPDTPKPLWAEQWPRVWLDAVCDAIADCVRRAAETEPGFAPEAVRALCIGGLYGGAGIPVDEGMRPLHPCLIWMDRRAGEEVEWVRAAVDLDRLYDVTGNGVDSYYGFTKILWIRRNAPQVWGRTRHFVPPNAFVMHALTGELAVDHSSAANIGGVYDLKRRSWSPEMLDALGIPASMMPPRLVESSEVVGGLTADAAGRLGLAAGTPVMAGGVDAAVATFAAGVTQPGQHVAMIGTSMCWGYISRSVDARHGLVSMPHVFGDPADTYVFGGAITAGASVTWFTDLLRGDEGGDADLLAALEGKAAQLPPGAEGLVFLPYLMGERSPIWDDRSSGAFVGLSLFHRREHLYRAVLEGVAFALRHNIEAGARGAATLDDDLIVVGGAARSDLWMQIIADVTGRRVKTIEQEVEAASGAALLAAYGAGLIGAPEAARGWVDLTVRATPRPQSQRSYERLFGVYKDLYPALRSTMHRLRGIEAAEKRE